MVFTHNMLIRLNPKGGYSIRTAQQWQDKWPYWAAPLEIRVPVARVRSLRFTPITLASNVWRCSHGIQSLINLEPALCKIPWKVLHVCRCELLQLSTSQNTDFLVCIFLQVKDFQSYTVNFEVAAFPDSFTLKFISNTNLAFINELCPLSVLSSSFKKYNKWKENAYAFSKNKNYTVTFK